MNSISQTTQQMDVNVVCCAGASTNIMLGGVRAPAMRYVV